MSEKYPEMHAAIEGATPIMQFLATKDVVARLYAAFEPVYEAKCKEIDALQEIVSLLEETTPRPMAAAADVPCVAHLNMSQWAKVSRIKTAITYRRLKESEEV